MTPVHRFVSDVSFLAEGGSILLLVGHGGKPTIKLDLVLGVFVERQSERLGHELWAAGYSIC